MAKGTFKIGTELNGSDIAFKDNIMIVAAQLRRLTLWYLFLCIAFYVDGWWGPNATTGIFIAAAITDWLDGYLARKVVFVQTTKKKFQDILM